jgi:hypothetical protein
MTELRDARLRKALHEAPDAQVRPPQRTREAILQAAHSAVQPGWRSWWRRTGDRRLPWGAALATVALATLITVMWEGREIPDSRREAAPDLPASSRAAAPARDAASQPAEIAADAAPAPAPVAPATGPGTIQPRTSAEPPPAALKPRARASERATPARAAAPKPQQHGTVRQKAEDPAPLHDSPSTDASTPAAEGAARAAAAREDLRARASGQPALPASSLSRSAPAGAQAPAAPAPASPLAQRQAAPSPPQAAVRASPASLPWTQVRIEAGDRSVVVSRVQADDLPALVTSLLASASDEADPTAPSTLRLELAQGDEAIGVLDAVGDRWRWTPLRGARDARMLRADPGISAALREHAERFLPR